jgi:dTDP-4-amino-4,6-dideoxygalactose transaminase
MASRNVLFFDYPRIFSDNKSSIISVLEDVGLRGAYIMQKDLISFEKTLADFVGCNYAIGVANATDGLELAWSAVGLQKNDEVIISAHTMLATASAIVAAGGIPIVVDIGDDGLIDPEAIDAAISPKTFGISPTQLNGRTCEMDKIINIANKNKLVVVEDAAQALGSSFKNKKAGSFGNVASFSFYPAKVLGSLGDGGGITTDNKDLFEVIFQLHDHGRDTSGEVKRWGRNSRLDNLQAAILNLGFKNYNLVIERRRKIASMYHERLNFLEQLILPPPPQVDSDHFDVYQNYELQAKNRDSLRSYLAQNGIGTLVQWGGKAVHQWDALGFNCRLPKAESFFEKCLMLPMNYFISDEDIEYVCEKIIEFYGNSN